MFIRKPLYYMAEEGSASGSAGEGEAGSGESGAGGASADTAEQKNAKAEEGKTFTQADVDRIISGRLTKFADYDAVKKQLGEIQAANATDSEKAIKAATEEGRKAGLAESAPRLVAAEFRAAATGRFTPEQLAELTEDLDLSKYLTDSGEVDTARITKKIDALAPAPASKTAPSFGGGTRKAGDKPDPSPGLATMRAAYAENTSKT